eukprot:1545349-Rhodomonas_salina.1
MELVAQLFCLLAGALTLALRRMGKNSWLRFGRPSRRGGLSTALLRLLATGQPSPRPRIGATQSMGAPNLFAQKLLFGYIS